MYKVTKRIQVWNIKSKSACNYFLSFSAVLIICRAEAYSKTFNKVS